MWRLYNKRLLKLIAIKTTVSFITVNGVHQCWNFSPSLHKYFTNNSTITPWRPFQSNFRFKFFFLNANNRQKTVKYLLSNSPTCMIQKNNINWYDFIINFLRKHRSNNDNPFTPENLIEVLKEYKNKISLIIYVHRPETPNNYESLVEIGILTLDVTKLLLSNRKANDNELIRKI